MSDGHVFRPDEPVRLEPDARYVLTVEREGAPAGADGQEGSAMYPLSALGALATDMGSRTWRRATTGTRAAGRATRTTQTARTGQTRAAARRAMRRSGSPVFPDTAYVYALLNARDARHAAAVAWERRLAARYRRSDKDWGLTDCASFVVMEERGLSEALTTDDHVV
jgi:hypothetical protein